MCGGCGRGRSIGSGSEARDDGKGRHTGRNSRVTPRPAQQAESLRHVKKLSIIGGGSWGTALAIVLAPRFPVVRLWVYETDLASRMRASRENDVFLPGYQLPSHVEVTNELAVALEGAEVVLSVMPSHLAKTGNK